MNKGTLKLALGRYDDPENQTQKHYTYDLYKSNLAIFGLAMSGKTTLLKTLLIRIHQAVRVTTRERIYILDFSNNLEPYKHLPYTVAYFDASQEENIRRIFHAVEERFTHNINCLPGKSYIQCPEDARPSHVTFILDGLNSFLTEDRYAAYQETLLKLARDGLAKGISVIFTASDTTDGVSKLLTSFGSIIALDFPKDKYAELYNKRTEKPISIPGRGMVNLNGNVYEFQAYFPYNADDPSLMEGDADASVIRRLEDRLRQCLPPAGEKRSTREILDHCMERRMKVFVSELTRDQWEYYTGTSWEDYQNSPECESTDLVLGLDYYNFTPVKFNLRTARSIAIYGRRAFGKTNLLGLILEKSLTIPNIRFVVWEDGRNGLSKNANTVKRILDTARAHGRLFEYTTREEFEQFLLAEYPGEFHPRPSTQLNSPQEGPCVLTPEQLNARENAWEEDTFDQEDRVAGNWQLPGDYAAKPRPFTLFLIQSRLFYQTAGMWFSDQFIPRMASFVNTYTSNCEKLFVFSDAQPIVDSECNVEFNNCLTHVFLLNDIMRYIKNRGQNSVFGLLDPDDIKERFGKCDLGDGFYYDMEGGEIQKLRFLKQLEVTEGEKTDGDI